MGLGLQKEWSHHSQLVREMVWVGIEVERFPFLEQAFFFLFFFLNMGLGLQKEWSHHSQLVREMVWVGVEVESSTDIEVQCSCYWVG